MNITAEDLIELVNEARKEITVMTPSQCFYRSASDYDEERFEYVCPQLLMSNLQKFIEDNK